MLLDKDFSVKVLDGAKGSPTGENGTPTEGPQKKITLTPGLLANGSPTSNSSASIAITNINANTNYGYAFDSLDFFDGKERHEH